MGAYITGAANDEYICHQVCSKLQKSCLAEAG